MVLAVMPACLARSEPGDAHPREQKERVVEDVLAEVEVLSLPQEARENVVAAVGDLRDGDYPAAAQDLEAALVVLGRERGLSGGPDVILDTLRDYAVVRRLLESIVDRYGGFYRAKVALAFVLVQEEEFDRAVALAREVLVAEPDNDLMVARAHLVIAGAQGFKASKAWVVRKLPLVLSARKHLRRAEALAPEYPLLLLGYSTYRIMVPGFLGGNVDRAEQDLRTCVEKAPNLANGHARLAQAHLKQKDFAKSERALSRALSIDPGNELALRVQEQLDNRMAKTRSG